MHHGPDRYALSRDEKELEAEAIAYVLALHFGLLDVASPDYLALWEVDEERMLEGLERIRTTATEIIGSIKSD